MFLLCGGICHVYVCVSGPNRQLKRLKSSQKEPKSGQTLTQTVEGKGGSLMLNIFLFFGGFLCLFCRLSLIKNPTETLICDDLY